MILTILYLLFKIFSVKKYLKDAEKITHQIYLKILNKKFDKKNYIILLRIFSVLRVKFEYFPMPLYRAFLLKENNIYDI